MAKGEKSTAGSFVELVVIVAGSPPGQAGKTNLIRVHRLGEDTH